MKSNYTLNDYLAGSGLLEKYDQGLLRVTDFCLPEIIATMTAEKAAEFERIDVATDKAKKLCEDLKAIISNDIKAERPYAGIMEGSSSRREKQSPREFLVIVTQALIHRIEAMHRAKIFYYGLSGLSLDDKEDYEFVLKSLEDLEPFFKWYIDKDAESRLSCFGRIKRLFKKLISFLT
jgi:hypothetical protein